MKIRILLDGTAYEVDVDANEETSAPVLPESPLTARSTIQSTVVPANAVLSFSSEGEEGLDESKVCRSPVAGLVVAVHVSSGAQLQVDDVVLVLEAMKMETRISAPLAGTIKSVKVAPGDAVKVNQILAEFV